MPFSWDIFHLKRCELPFWEELCTVVYIKWEFGQAWLAIVALCPKGVVYGWFNPKTLSSEIKQNHKSVQGKWFNLGLPNAAPVAVDHSRSRNAYKAVSKSASYPINHQNSI